MNDDQLPVVFAMNGATGLASRIESWISGNWIPGFRLAAKEEYRRHDREFAGRSRVNVRGRKVYIIQSFATDEQETVDEKVWGTVLFAHSLRDASCAGITVLGPMLPYMRQDQKDAPRAGINTAAFVRQMSAAGVDRLVTMDVHNVSALQNCCSALGVQMDHLESRCLLAREVARKLPLHRRIVVLTPDLGATKRASSFKATLEKFLSLRAGGPIPVGFAQAIKVRKGDEQTEHTGLIEDPEFPIAPRNGEPQGALVISPDDILATASTIKGLWKAVRTRRGEFYAVCVTHGLFTGNALFNLTEGLYDRPVVEASEVPLIYTTDSVSHWRTNGTVLRRRLVKVDTSSVWGRAIKETHQNGSINTLLTALEEES